MSHFETECVVIGAGVVGLAVARALAQAGRETIIIERENMIGTGTSSRNSEVIHAGIYYPKGSLKAIHCVRGKEMLYRYCAESHVPHKNIKKVIVAINEDQVEKLKEIDAKARANGVEDLRFLSKAEINNMEPNVTAVGALLSPSTGIIDSHKYMEILLGDADNAGASIVYNAPVESGVIKDGGITLSVGGADPCTITCKYLVNSAGLYAVKFLHTLKNFGAAHIPEQYYAKGNYFILNGKSPFNHLVYPIPVAAGLGTHATLDMGGACRFGPDVEWVDSPEDLAVDPTRAPSFYEAIRTYWPGLPDGALQPGYAGMRPKLQTPTGPAADFVIQGKETHGIPGLVNLLGIESPGLTSSLSIAETTKDLLFS
jgi:L-2-hydroxyglutarate oxidase LhgO